jgi:L-ascorbate metabolism protein UlaG (beta-lactamase superfamily)
MASAPLDSRRRFRNLDGSGPHPPGAVFRWAVLDRLAGRRRRSPASAQVPVIAPDRALLAMAASRPRITWLGHASFLVQLDGASLLIDPVFSDRIASLIPRNVPAPLPARDLPRIDATLITHNHYDHLDTASVRAVGAHALAGLGMSRLVRCEELDWWQGARIGGVHATFVPSQHWSRRGLLDTNHALWGGFVVQGPSGSVYHAGDTAYFGGFREIGRRFPQIDAALLPIGAYDPPWFMEQQHMNPEQVVQAFLDLGARRLVAMHWGTFKLTDEPLDEPPRRLRAEWSRRGLDEKALFIPAVGETIDLGR